MQRKNTGALHRLYVGMVAACAVVAMMLSTVPAYAATTVTQSNSSTVTMTSSATNISITVPTYIATSVATDGTITSADSPIQHDSAYAIYVQDLKATVSNASFNLTTASAYSASTASNAFHMYLIPAATTAGEADLGGFTTASAPTSGYWNVGAAGKLTFAASGAIKNLATDLATSTSVGTVDWTFALGSQAAA